LTDVVVDASATIEILLGTPAGQSLARQVPSPATEWVPEIYFAEVAGALRRAELSRRITKVKAEQYLDQLLRSPARRAAIKPLISEAWTLRPNITITDALYVVLARHLGATLITADGRLARAPALGVRTIVP
jgi:predicted nucleic acid-binding protein